MPIIVNAAPRSYYTGVNDLSGRDVPTREDNYPQHLAKIFIQSEKGPTETIVGTELQIESIFGENSFDKNSKFFNHASSLADTIMDTETKVMIQRIVAEDETAITANKATVTLYADVKTLAAQPSYERNADGHYTLDGSGLPIQRDDGTPITVDKKEVRFFTSTDEDAIGVSTFAGGGSTIYKLLTIDAVGYGDYYNNLGIGVFDLTDEQINEKFKTVSKTLQYGMQIFNRETGTSHSVKNLNKEDSTSVVFKSGVNNPVTNGAAVANELFPDEWYNVDDDTLPLAFPELSNLSIHRTGDGISASKGLDDFVEDLITNEITIEDSNTINYLSTDGAVARDWIDFDIDSYGDLDAADRTEIKDTMAHLFNWVGLTNTNGAPYEGAIPAETSVSLTGSPANFNEVTLGRNNPLWLSNGADVLLTPSEYETGVIQQLEKYADNNSEVQDLAVNIESTIWDSGFTMDTKFKICDTLLIRPDHNIILSTYEATSSSDTGVIPEYPDPQEDPNNPRPLSVDKANGDALMAKLEVYPESLFYGTDVARAMIVMGSGYRADKKSLERLPLTHFIAKRVSEYMGNEDGAWVPGKFFGNAPLNNIDDFINIYPKYMPNDLKANFWKSNLVWPENNSRTTFYFPGQQTVFNDDTSVLNNVFTMFAVSTLTKLAAKAHRQFTGSVPVNNAIFADDITTYLTNEIQGIFDDRVTVEVQVTFTDLDELRGYSYTLTLKLYSTVMKTVQTAIIESYRLSDK